MRLLPIFLVVFGAACGANLEHPTSDDDLRRAFPGVAARVLADDGEPLSSAGPLGFVAPAMTDDPIAAADAAIARVSVLMPLDADDGVALSMFDGFAVRVRESDVAGHGKVEGAHVRYARVDGASYWSRSGDGMEEWLHILDPRPGVLASWTVAGARFFEHDDGSVGVVASDGRERMRVVAPEAYGASGKTISASLEVVAGDELALVATEDVVGESSILVDPIWIPVGSMANARYRFSMTALGNGKVLVAGGLNGTTWLSSCELYDPSTGQWSAAHAMETPRGYHAAVLLPNGNVLVEGGTTTGGVVTAATEFYVPSIDNWVGVQFMSHARSGHTATLLTSGKVLVAGGGTAFSELFDPSAGTWSSTGSMQLQLSDNTATKISNGRVLAVGGLNQGTVTATAEIYTESTGQWTYTTSLPAGQQRTDHTATLLRNGQVLVAGGRSGSTYLANAYKFNPSNNQWTAAGTLYQPRAFHTATLLPNDNVVVIGGQNGTGFSGINTFETYNPVNNSWGSQSSATQRTAHSATMLESGRVLIAGGVASFSLTSAFIFNNAFGTDTWTQSSLATDEETDGDTFTQMPDGTVLIVGQWIDGSNQLQYRAVRFDPNTGTTTPTQALAYNMSQHTATLLMDGRVFVANGDARVWDGTGWDDQDDTIQSQIYDPSTNQWTATAWSHQSRKSARAVLLPNGKVLVAGGVGTNCNPGFDCLSYWLPPSEIYDPTSNTWTQLQSSEGFYGHTLTLLANGDALIAGGTNTWDWANTGGPGAPGNLAAYFSTASGQITSYLSMQNARCDHTAEPLADGRVALLGGSSVDCVNGGAGVAAVELYNPQTQSFQAAGNMYRQRWGHQTTTLVNGWVMSTGGASTSLSTFFVDDSDLFDPSTGNSYPGPRLHRSFGAPQMLATNNKVEQFHWCYPDNLQNVPCNPYPVWFYDEGRGVLSTPPSITSWTTSASPGGTIMIFGSGIDVDAEGTQGAATNTAEVLLTRFDSENQVMAPVTAIGSSLLYATVPSTAPSGWYDVRVVVNGIPSVGGHAMLVQ
jgi:N-acetylneuraminic acid mutarotase